MHVLKIGDRFLNVDQVTEFTVDGNTLIAHFGPHHETRFGRQDAVLLRRWLERMSVDIAAPEDETPTTPLSETDRPMAWPDRRCDRFRQRTFDDPYK